MAGSVQRMWVALREDRVRRRPSRCRSRRPRGRARRGPGRAALAPRRLGAGASRRGVGGDQAQARGRARRTCRLGALPSAMRRARAASGVRGRASGEHGEPGALRVGLGEQHRGACSRRRPGGRARARASMVPAPPASPQTATSGPPGSSKASPQAVRCRARAARWESGCVRLWLRLPMRSPPTRSARGVRRTR